MQSPIIALVSAIALPLLSQGGNAVSVERRPAGSNVAFVSVPAPANNDAATTAEFLLIKGERDRNGSTTAVLHDGLIATQEDEPSANFFLRASTEGGWLRLDLGKTVAVKQVNTYSRHPDTRAPQVYRLYATDGLAAGFDALPQPATDPKSCGWTEVAIVDTRLEDGDDGGQHRVSVFDPAQATLGTYRYLLFEISPTETRDPFGNTFFSEIDVIDANGPAPTQALAPAAPEPILKSFTAENGKYHFTLDCTAAPDLTAWAETELRPVIQKWYPKLVVMLPSDGFAAPTNLTLRFRNDMGGTPASAGGNRINMNSEWFRRELNREARGSVVHEMVHVVQSYGRSRRTNPNAVRTPGWLVEGLADYIRWFLYEPETKGAEITARNLERARYDASYRVTGNFLNWIAEHYGQDIIRKLNAVAREGNYNEALWEAWTGQTLPELGDAWKQEHETRLEG